MSSYEVAASDKDFAWYPGNGEWGSRSVLLENWETESWRFSSTSVRGNTD